MKNYKGLFGQRIKINHKLVRKKRFIQNSWNTYKKSWEKQHHTAEVIVIGKRNLSDVEVWYDGEGIPGYNFIQSFPALLVVENMKENPFYTKIEEHE